MIEICYIENACKRMGKIFKRNFILKHLQFLRFYFLLFIMKNKNSLGKLDILIRFLSLV